MLRASRADPLLDDPAAEANHRIANSLSIVASLIHAQSENLPAEGTLPVTNFRDRLQERRQRLKQSESCIVSSSLASRAVPSI